MKYLVHMEGFASAVMVLDADSPRKAADRAYEELDVNLCHVCDAKVALSNEFIAVAVTDTFKGAEHKMDDSLVDTLYKRINELEQRIAELER